jgi:nitrogen regulatory protein P-II 1
MKEIKAFIRVSRADEVLAALAEAGFSNATLSHVLAVGPNLDPDETMVSMEFGRKVNRMAKLELICPDEELDKGVEAIRRGAWSGQSGDGIVAIADVRRLVKIRTGKESVEAL